MDEKPFHLWTNQGSELSVFSPVTGCNSSLILAFLQQGFLEVSCWA